MRCNSEAWVGAALDIDLRESGLDEIVAADPPIDQIALGIAAYIGAGTEKWIGVV
jgi:hypothetical protein